MMNEGKSTEENIQVNVDGWNKSHQPLFDGWVKEALAAQK